MVKHTQKIRRKFANKSPTVETNSRNTKTRKPTLETPKQVAISDIFSNVFRGGEG